MNKGKWTDYGALADQAARWIPDDITSTLRGLSQVIFIKNQISGLFIIAALYVGGGPLLATTALASTFVSTAIALRTFKDVESVRNGAAGFNACCIGAVFPVFVRRSFSITSFIAALWCGVAATYLNLSIKRVFGAMPSLTFAFNAVIITCVLYAFDRPSALPQLQNTVENLLLVPLVSISQIFAVNNAYAGFLIIIGAAIDSWGIALFAIGGSIVGSVTGYVLCDDGTFKVLNGLFGFNSALMAIVIGVYYVPTLASISFGVVASIATAILTQILGVAMDRSLGVPAFSLPFCLVATACHLILTDGTVRGLISAITPTSPEANLKQHRASMNSNGTSSAKPLLKSSPKRNSDSTFQTQSSSLSRDSSTMSGFGMGV